VKGGSSRSSVVIPADAPIADKVQERYAGWLAQQQQAGITFSDTERWWLDRIVGACRGCTRL